MAAPRTTRRGAVGRGLALVAGAIGVGASAGGARAAPPAVPAGPKPIEQLTLRGRGLRLHGPGRQPGRMPDGTDLASAHGTLVDADGREIGMFRSAALPGAVSRFQLHTFELADGTIMGLGADTLGEGAFAIVGGTGRYTGLTGAYVARQSPKSAGGDGSAEFVLTLT